MAIDAKVSLQQQIETKLMTEVTADVMNRTLRIVASALEMISSYYMRMVSIRIHAGSGSPAGSTPATGTNGQKPKYGSAGAGITARSFHCIWQPERRRGFRDRAAVRIGGWIPCNEPCNEY